MSRWLRVAENEDILERASKSLYDITEGGLTVDNPKYEEALNNISKDYYCVMDLIQSDKFSYNNPYYESILKFILKSQGSFHARTLIEDKIVTRDNPYYEKVIDKIIESPFEAKSAIEENVITLDDPFYYKVKEAAEKD